MDRKENYDYNACDELRCMDGVVFEYDLKGNMTRKIDPSEGVTQYAYDYQNRLFRITYPDKTQSRYYYNSSGLRTAKTDGIEPRPDSLPSSAGRTTYYYWDGTEIESIPNAINESDETGGITNTCWPEIGFKSINNGGSATGGSATGGGSSSGGSGFASGGLGTAGGGQWRFFITDHLGSVIALTDESGNITDQYEYDEYGAITSKTGTSYNTRFYIGQEYDQDSELVYLGARYYDPKTGRFISRDPIGIGDGLNEYVYGKNNPINFLDVLGLYKVGTQTQIANERFWVRHNFLTTYMQFCYNASTQYSNSPWCHEYSRTYNVLFSKHLIYHIGLFVHIRSKYTSIGHIAYAISYCDYPYASIDTVDLIIDPWSHNRKHCNTINVRDRYYFSVKTWGRFWNSINPVFDINSIVIEPPGREFADWNFTGIHLTPHPG